MDGTGEVAALDGAGERGPERAIGRGQAKAAGRDRLLVREGRGDTSLQAGGRDAGRVAIGRGGIGATGGRLAAHGERSDDRGQLRAGRRDRRQQPARLAHQLADGPRADRGQLTTEILGQRQDEPLDHLGRAR